MENKFELFAIVELFGHQKMAGKVTEHTIGSATFIRIDVPETKRSPTFTRFINPASVYAIKPVTEEVAKESASRIASAPIELWDIEAMHNKLLALKGASHEPDERD